VRVGSREAHVSPNRGAQGNALKTLLAMPFALDGERGETVIEAGGAAHRIAFAVDRIRQEPKIERAAEQRRAEQDKEMRRRQYEDPEEE
jgi:hypothetical protein